jgi:hypothetical protein
VLFGALALGSALFGALAQAIGVPRALVAAGAAVALGRFATWRQRLPEGDGPISRRRRAGIPSWSRRSPPTAGPCS